MQYVYRTIMAAIMFFVSATAAGNDICSLEQYIKDAEIIFEDNFDGEYLDSTRWERCPEGNRHGNLCTWDDDMSYLDGDGRLVIDARWDEQDMKLHSGAVWTNDIFEGTLGYYEASVKLPYVPGVWGSFWMIAGIVAGENYSSADGVEIDIVESSPLIENEYGMVMHWDGYGEAKQKLHKPIYDGNIYDGEFHTFGLWRRSDGYIFYIDNQEVWRVSDREADVCPLPGYMVFSFEGAEWAGTGTAESVNALPAQMLVDYVRVYKKPVEAENFTEK